jgi:sugar phosphate isomerase/epimerase
MTHADIGAILADNGLEFVEIEALLDWFCEGERRRTSDQSRHSMLANAERLGARHIKVVGDIVGDDWPLDAVIESFAGLCDDAREAGTRVTIELFPESSIADLATGLAIVNGAGRSNGGLLLDIWHMVRGNIDFAEIAKLPHGTISHIELDDAALEQHGSILDDTIDRRRFCGEGEFDVIGFLRSVQATGYDGLYGCEILSTEQRQLPVEQAAMHAYKTTRACLDRA